MTTHVRQITLSACLALLTFPVWGQNVKVIDSLKGMLNTSPPAAQFELLNAVGFEYRYSFPDSTIAYCNRAYALGQQLELKKGLSRPLSFIGLAKANQGDYTSALEYHNRSVDVAREQEDTIQLAHAYNNIGRIFFDQGDLVRAFTDFEKARELFEKIQDKSGLAYVYRSLAGVFKAKKDYAKALENSNKALDMREQLGDSRTITSAHMELGLLYEEMDSTPLALREFKIADSIASTVNDKITKLELSVGMAEILFMEKRLKEAAVLAEEVIASVSESNNQKIFLRARILLAKCQLENGQSNTALSMLQQVYRSSEKSGNLSFQRDASLLLSKIYRSQGNPVKAGEFTGIYQILDGKIQNADLNKEIERLQFQLLIEKTEKENASLKAKQAEAESVIATQRLESTLR